MNTFLMIVIVVLFFSTLSLLMDDLLLRKQRTRLLGDLESTNFDIQTVEISLKRLSTLKGICEVRYNKTETERALNYAFDFENVDDLRQKLQRHENADQIFIHLSNQKEFINA